LQQRLKKIYTKLEQAAESISKLRLEVERPFYHLDDEFDNKAIGAING
jgi:hypothetical protein